MKALSLPGRNKLEAQRVIMVFFNKDPFVEGVKATGPLPAFGGGLSYLIACEKTLGFRPGMNACDYLPGCLYTVKILIENFHGASRNQWARRSHGEFPQEITHVSSGGGVI